MLKDTIKEEFPFLYSAAKELEFRRSGGQSLRSRTPSTIDIMAQWKSVIASSSPARLAINEGGRRIFFVTGFGLGSHYHAIEPLIMMALQARGARITSFSCGKSLPACEFNRVGNQVPAFEMHPRPGLTRSTLAAQCAVCVENLDSLYDLLPIERDTYERHRLENDVRIAREAADTVTLENLRSWCFEGIGVGDEAFASILRTTLRGQVRDTPYELYLARRYVMSGVMHVLSMRRALEAHRPEKVVLVHGLYLTHGIASRVAKAMGLPVVVMGSGGIRKDTVVLCHGQTYHHQLIDEDNRVWEDADLTEPQKATTLRYALEKRTNGAAVDYVTYHPNPKNAHDEIRGELALPATDDRPIVSFFTNVCWDAQILYKSNVYEDIFAWVRNSIAIVARNPRIIGVIRIHPAETKGSMKTQQPMADEIQKWFPRLPENIRIVSPENDCSSYSLAEMSRLSVIYGTKMGLELALMRVPLLICGETFSRNKGYGIDVPDRQAYESLLMKAHEHPPQSAQAFDRALKYAHYLYFRRMLKIPMESTVGAGGLSRTKLLISRLEDLDAGTDPVMDVISRGILEDQSFCLPHSNSDASP
jgi:hypothetical protein